MNKITENDIKSGLDFIHKALMQETESDCQVFCFLSKFKEAGEKTKSKQPCHINVIDELHANENAHSRILAKLLQQKTPENDRFEILESFVRYLKKKFGTFGNISVESPEITQETERIDLWIRDRNYAVIVENKIHWASDQETQIERYIETTRSYGFAEKPIYVVYLSPTCDKKPDVQSWGKYFDSEIYRERYLILSFREDIRLWLEDDVLPNVRIKDVYLKSAIEQYIDHLKGMFDLREIDKQINMELQEFIKKELGLSGIPQENVAKLVAKQEELSKVNNQLQLLKDDNEKVIFREWNTNLSKTYPDCRKLNKDDGFPVLIVKANDIEIRVSLGIYKGQLLCQLDRDHLPEADRILPEEMKEKIKQRLSFPSENKGQLWKCFPRYSYDEVYNRLIDVIKILTT
jgi:hypothetical protein